MTQFDIIVPTYNRAKELPFFFERNSALQSAYVHVWIVDDCSPHFDSSVIPLWPNLTLIRLEKNKGQAFARNVAIEKGNAPFIISLDDDAWFENVPRSLEQIEQFFNDYPDAGCQMFNIATPNSFYSNMESGTLLALHVTCGCAYRRQIITGIGGFSEFLHSGAEETDLSIRIYQANSSIRFINEIKVFHNFNPAYRSLTWYRNVRYNTTRNDLLIVLMTYPILLVIPFVLGKFISHLRFAIAYRYKVRRTFLVTMWAFVGFLLLSPKAIEKRNPLTWLQFRHWRGLLKNGL